MSKYTARAFQWLTTIGCSLGVLYSAHGLNLEYDRTKFLAQNNIWDQISPSGEVNDVLPPERTPQENQINLKSEPAAQKDSNATLEQSIPNENPAMLDSVKPEEAPKTLTTHNTEDENTSTTEEIEKSQKQESNLTELNCPKTEIIQQKLLSGTWVDNDKVTHWVDFVTRPLYENDKVSKFVRAIYLNPQIGCEYHINNDKSILLLIKNAHKNGLQPTSENWNACSSFECDQECNASISTCGFEILK